MDPGNGAGLAPRTTLGSTRRASCDIATWLVARPAQSGFQFLLLLFPARVLRLRPSVECSAVSFDFFDLGFMVTLRFFKRCFGLCDCLLAPLAFLLPRDLFLPALAIAPLPFSLERKGGLACGFVVDLLSRRSSCRRSRLRCPLLHLVDGEFLRQLGMFAERAIRSDRAPQNDARFWRTSPQQSRDHRFPSQSLAGKGSSSRPRLPKPLSSMAQQWRDRRTRERSDRS
jgi:hypothetical protein